MNIRTPFILSALMLCSAGAADKGTWVIDAQSQLTIQGSTNVNDFVCRMEYSSGRDTLEIVQNKRDGVLVFTRSLMRVPIRDFDCGARPVSRDFRKTLKADVFPDMTINFISLQGLYFRHNTYINGTVDITLAGVTTRYTIAYFITVKDNGLILLKGSRAVNFSDFRLAAPERLNGLIKVKEVLNVDFNLVLKEV